ncbi:MAG: hypothetical protein U0Q16_07685 [Bryobacteraceae bacterium]
MPDHAPRLFVDLDEVESLENSVREFHSAEKHPANPVLRKLHPWENARGTWGSVIYDAEERIFKAWYGGTSGRDVSGCTGPNCRSNSVLCYATSQDGIVWQRPKLRLHEATGTLDNNVVIGDDHRDGMAHWESVRKDPLEQDPSRRYKALGWSSFDWDGPQSGIFTMTSPDGLRWTHTANPVFHYHPRPGTNDLGPIGDAHSLMIDTLKRRYVAYLRRIPHRAMSVSTDFVKWSPSVVCLRAEDGEMANTVYNHSGFVYGDRYLGLLTYFVRDPKDPRLTVWLLSSRDGENWVRAKAARPLIGPGEIGDVDRFTNMITGAPPIRVGDKLYIYYRALANRHSPYEGKDSTLEGGGISLATLRADGFASIAAGYDGGTVTTRPFVLDATSLWVNTKADFGELRAEVLDEKRSPIAGLTAAECEPVRVDSVRQAIRWRTALAVARGRSVRLRFHLRNSRLYSYTLG